MLKINLSFCSEEFSVKSTLISSYGLPSRFGSRLEADSRGPQKSSFNFKIAEKRLKRLDLPYSRYDLPFHRIFPYIKCLEREPQNSPSCSQSPRYGHHIEGATVNPEKKFRKTRKRFNLKV